MASRSMTDIQRMWNEKGGNYLENNYKKWGISKTQLGEFLGYKASSRLQSLRKIIIGDSSMTPEQIQVLARNISDDHINQGNLESQLACNSGNLMPSLIVDLEENVLAQVLDVLAKVTNLLHEFSPHQGNKQSIKPTALQLLLVEINKTVEGWRMIYDLEQSISNMIERKTDENEAIFTPWLMDKWYMLNNFLNQSNHQLQIIYSQVGWAHLLSQSGASKDALIAADIALKHISELDDDISQTEPILKLVFRAHFVAGNCHRVIGNFGEALRHFNSAKASIINSSLGESMGNRVKFNIFNTYVVADLYPPQELLHSITALARNKDQTDEIRSRAYLALAHFERNVRGERIENAERYGMQGLMFAETSNNNHRVAVGNLYLGETQLKLGDFQGASKTLITAFSLFDKHNHSRLGFTSFMLGRTEAYLALWLFEKRKSEWVKALDEALIYFSEGVAEFSKAYQQRGMSESAQQWMFLLTEQAKWEVIKIATEYVIDRGDGSHLGETIQLLEKAKEKLSMALLLLPNARIEQGDSVQKRKINVYETLIDLVRIILFSNGSLKELALLEETVNQQIWRDDEEIIPPVGFPSDAKYFETVLLGNLAILYAIRGAARLLLENEKYTKDINKCIELSYQYNFPTFLDCRWIIGLAFNLRLWDGDFQLEFDKKIKGLQKDRMQKYLIYGSSRR